MKIVSVVSICGLLTLTSFQLKSQVSLPYFSGFDDAAQQDGWIEYKTASTLFSNWGYGTIDAYSAPTCVSHDYSPSTGITLTDNWFVSPEFSITNGGLVDSIRYMFSGFSTPTTGDTIGVYLLNGSQDPTLATSETLLFDFRGSEYIADNVYRVKTDLILPASPGLSYLALRYRNTDCSTQWLTVFFDNIAISGETIGLDDMAKSQIEIYPNPSTGSFNVKSEEVIESVVIQNQLGQVVHYAEVNKKSLEINLPDLRKGIYSVSLSVDGKMKTQKLIID